MIRCKSSHNGSLTSDLGFVPPLSTTFPPLSIPFPWNSTLHDGLVARILEYVLYGLNQVGLEDTSEYSVMSPIMCHGSCSLESNQYSRVFYPVSIVLITL